MAWMGPPHRGDFWGMARRCQPVVHRGPDPAPLDGRLAPAFVTGDQQQDSLAGRNRAVEPEVDRPPRAVEIVTVEVDDAVRFRPPRLQPLVPASVEGGANRRTQTLSRRCWPPGHGPGLWRWCAKLFFRRRCSLRFRGIARQRPNGRRHPRPQLRFVSVEGAHGRPCPWAAESGPGRWPSFRPRSGSPAVPRPRRCRSGWRP